MEQKVRRTSDARSSRKILDGLDEQRSPTGRRAGSGEVEDRRYMVRHPGGGAVVLDAPDAPGGGGQGVRRHSPPVLHQIHIAGPSGSIGDNACLLLRRLQGRLATTPLTSSCRELTAAGETALASSSVPWHEPSRNHTGPLGALSVARAALRRGTGTTTRLREQQELYALRREIDVALNGSAHHLFNGIHHRASGRRWCPTDAGSAALPSSSAFCSADGAAVAARKSSAW